MQTDVLMIGGGQAGLAMGYHLARRGVDHVILDAEDRVGNMWRNRWDSLTLFTPARYSALPGLEFPGDPEGYPGKDAVADYLEAYASGFGLPVRSGERVRSLGGSADGYAAEAESGVRYEARQVVVATGPFQRPAVPPVSAGLATEVLQLHSSEYRTHAQIRPGDVVVVGAGNSGVQIAAELARTHRVHLAVGTRMPRLPERVLGRSVFWWLERAGLLDVTVESWLGRRMSRADTLIGSSPARLRRHGVRVRGRVEGVSGDTVRFADGHTVRQRPFCGRPGFGPSIRGSMFRYSALGEPRSSGAASQTYLASTSSDCPGCIPVARHSSAG